MVSKPLDIWQQDQTENRNKITKTKQTVQQATRINYIPTMNVCFVLSCWPGSDVDDVSGSQDSGLCVIESGFNSTK
jgi:hypothetical protein